MTVVLEVIGEAEDKDLKDGEKLFSWGSQEHDDTIIVTKASSQMEAADKVKKLLNDLLENKYTLNNW